MNLPDDLPIHALQLLEPDPDAVYTIEAVEHLVNVPRRMILLYYKHGLVSPVVDPACGGYYFNDEAIRALRRIDYLRNVCGINIEGIRMILELLHEVEQLRAEMRFRYR
jgi:MerR family transcriptional regulator/heat shock protein HspR